MDESGIVDFEAADTDGNWALTGDEACPHYFLDYPSICDDIPDTGNDIADAYFMYDWYKMDEDKDEIVSFDDFYAW